MRPLERQGALELWDDSRIALGSDWRQEIRRALANSKVAVLFVSAQFLASDFIASDELPPLLAKAANGGTLIVPIIVDHCRFEETTGLSRFQAANDPRQPLFAQRKPQWEAVLLRVARSIEAALRS
jgi:hypothetical protein